MKAKHTKSPWEVKNQWGYIRIHSEDDGVCRIDGMGSQEKANAHLIASAPDLLDALKALMVTEHMLRDQNCEVMRNAKLAIKKAEGK